MAVTVINRTERRIRTGKVREFVKKVLELLGEEKGSLSVVFVSSEELREYNLKFRENDAYTDVMAFPGDGDYLGDILVAPDVVEKNAEDLNVEFDAELKFVLVHGILHLMGYTDYSPEEKEEMFKMQEEILRKLEDDHGITA